MPRYVSFLGPPGSGKTTQIRLLAELLGDELLVASVPRLLRCQPGLISLLTAPEIDELRALMAPATAAREAGELAPIAVDRLLFAAVSRAEGVWTVALDGCPRGAAQASLFLDCSIATETAVIELGFAGEIFDWSVQRQLERESKRRGDVEALARRRVYERKARVFLDDTSIGLECLKAAGVPCRYFDATAHALLIHAGVCQELGILPMRQMSLIGGD